MPTGICKICFKPIQITSIATFLFKNLTVCEPCFDMFRPIYESFIFEGVSAYAAYHYDDFIKEKLYLLKGCHDYELKDIFFDRQQHLLRFKYAGYTIVPIPSWAPDDEARGFNHVEAIFSHLKLPMLKILFKTRKHKQSDLSYSKRLEVKNLFVIADVDISKKNILLVDDVMTSGSSLRACLSLIKSKRPQKIKILLLSKTKPPDKSLY